MKFIKHNKFLTMGLNPLLLLIGILLFFYLPTLCSYVGYLFWISTAAALFLILTPAGNSRLGEKTAESATRLPIKQWFFCILLLELTLLGVYLGMSFINGDVFPINTTLHTDLFSASLKTDLLHYGLFPWNLYALISVGMGFLAYRENTDAYFSNLVKSITHAKTDHAFSAIINIGIRRCTLFALSITLLFLTILFISIINPYFAYGFQTQPLLTTLALFLFMSTAMAKKYSARIFSRSISTQLSLPFFCLALGVSILILESVTKGLMQDQSPPVMPVFFQGWISFPWSTAWSIFSAMWWICLTPVISGFIIRISRGYRIRSIIIAVLILPSLITLFFIFSTQIQWTSLTLSPIAIKLLSLLSFIILLPLLLNHQNSSNAIFSYFPKKGVIKPRDHQAFFYYTLQLTIVALCFYLVLGINALSLFIFIPNFPAIASMFLAIPAIVKNIVLNK